MALKSLHIIMGVSGCGKSTIASLLSDQTGWPWIEADDHHSKSNIEKMKSGVPLDDNDRTDWVEALLSAVQSYDTDNVILACSALTPFVQQELSKTDNTQCHWYLLNGSKDVIKNRMQSRDHFMPSSLLESQLEALSAPSDALNLSIEKTPDEICKTILANKNR